MSPLPKKNLAVVACMDCRLDVETILDLEHGDAHVIRNAGGVLTDDVRRSLLLSQRALGTRTIALIHHTDCGLQGVDEEALFAEIEAEVGQRPDFSLASFEDAADDVRQMKRSLIDDPIVPYTDDVRGYVFDVETHELVTVE